MTKLCGLFSGLRKEECRKKVISLFEKNNLIQRVETINSKVPYSEKSGNPIEFRISQQYFLHCKSLIKQGRGDKNFYNLPVITPQPKYRAQLQKHLEKMEDWCISRQIKLGVLIPDRRAEKKSRTKDVLDT